LRSADHLPFRPGFRSRPRRRRSGLLAVLALVVTVAGLTQPASAREADRDEVGVTRVTGEVALTNPFVVEDPNEPFVVLANLAPYVGTDYEAEFPVEEQTLGPILGSAAEGTYALQLPAAPRGSTIDADPTAGAEGTEVGVFAVNFVTSIVGDPFLQAREFLGYRSSMSTVSFDAETGLIDGGRVLVWAAEPAPFPSGYGADGTLFTDDDPVATAAPGWTVVDLGAAVVRAKHTNAGSFSFLRGRAVEADIIEGDTGFTDYADRSFTEAFDALVDDLARDYPFLQYKDIDLGALVEEYRPLVQAAEREDDVEAFQLAIKQFTLEFGDGHVGSTTPTSLREETFGGDLGLRLGETDDGEVVVTAVRPGGSADEAGIETGAVVTAWDGDPIDAAIDAQPLLSGESAPFAARLQRLHLLPRKPVGTDVKIAYANADGRDRTATLTALEGEPLTRADLMGTYTAGEAPVSSRLLPSGVGYIRVNSFSEDNNLAVDAWDWAIAEFTELEATGLIVDVRGNGGGLLLAANYFAGSFIDERLLLDEFALPDGEGDLVGLAPDYVEPSETQWDGPVAVLIDESCASACEYFSAAVALADEANLIVGSTPTAGVYAAVAPWSLPGDTYFQASAVAFTRDGEVFLEGKGLPPTLDVPVTAESLLSPEDEVLAAADDALAEAAAEATPEPGRH